MSLLEIQTLVDNLVRDDSGQTDATDHDEAIALAVNQYSKDKPYEEVEDLTSAGGNYLDMPVKWQIEYSILQAIEYPIGRVPPTYLEVATYGIYNSPTGRKIMLNSALSNSDQARVTYTIRHVLDGANDTIPVDDNEAVASWAAAVICEQLASHYSGDQDASVLADAVDHQDLAARFARRASTLRKRYYDMLGIEPKRNRAHGTVVDLDMSNSRGRDRLTHPGRYR